MPTVGEQEFPYTEEGMIDAEAAASGIKPMQEETPFPTEDAAEEVANSGRGGDTIAAHLTIGEIVLPPDVANQLYEQIAEIIGEENMGSITVGDPDNSINPETGMPEFGLTGRSKKRKKKMRAEMARFEKQLMKRTNKIIETNEKEMESRMLDFKSSQDLQTAEFNKNLAEDRESSRVMAIRRSRAFKSDLFGASYKASFATKEAQGAAGTPQEFNAPSFFGTRKKGTKIGGKGFAKKIKTEKRPR
jgi:hypothetical protein